MENWEKYTHFGSKHNTHVLKLPLRLLLLFHPSSIAKGKSWQQVPQEVDVPLLRKAVRARGWPSSQAECAICFPVLDLAYNFLLKQLVAKLTNASICREPVWLLRTKGCSHQILLRGHERLPLNLQHFWVAEIPYSGKPTPLSSRTHTGLCLLRAHTGSSYSCKTLHTHHRKWRSLKINGESRS